MNKDYICPINVQRDKFPINTHRGIRPPDLQQIVLCHVGRQYVLQQDLVDAPHGLHSLLLAAQLCPPEEVCPVCSLSLAVQEVEDEGEDAHGQGHGKPQGPVAEGREELG